MSNEPSILAYIGLGANIGPVEQTLRAAVDRLADLPQTHLIAVAPFRITRPVGGPPDQPDFLNSVVALGTFLPPGHLLSAMLEIERDFGRDRSCEPRHGPRVLDLDLLLYGDAVIDQAGLTVPHPFMHHRRFVLEPLAQIAPNVRHPILGLSASALLQRLDDDEPAPRSLAAASPSNN